MVALPTGVVYYNTTTTDILVGSTLDGLIIKIIWSHHMTNVKMLLGQFTMSWHQDEIIAEKVGIGEDLQPTKGEGHGSSVVKGEHPLTISHAVQVQF